MKKGLSILLCLTLLFSLCAVSVAAVDNGSFGAYDHVFIIGVDGAGPAFSQVESPCFDAIFGDFAYRHDAQKGFRVITLDRNDLWRYETHTVRTDALLGT